MRQLWAEMRKFRRPLVYWLIGALVIITALIVQSRQSSATGAPEMIRTLKKTQKEIPSIATYLVPTCRSLHLPQGRKCKQAQWDEIQRQQATIQPNVSPSTVADSMNQVNEALLGQNPIGAGRDAVGFVTSVFGTLIILLLAAGHIGGEFSGRTMRNVLTQEPRRWRVLLMKGLSLWMASVLILVLVWLVLALLSFVFRSLYPLEGFKPLTISQAASIAIPDVLRSLLVLAAYSALGLAAAIITRNVLGTFVVSAGIFIVLVIAGQSEPLANSAWQTGLLAGLDGRVIPTWSRSTSGTCS